jgi:hypothetical protein
MNNLSLLQRFSQKGLIVLATAFALAWATPAVSGLSSSSRKQPGLKHPGRVTDRQLVPQYGTRSVRVVRATRR